METNTTATDRLKVGVVGVGSLGQWHARIYSELPTSELVGIYDTDRDRAEKIARTYRTVAFDSLEALADRIQAASVAVPAGAHFDIASRLMERDVNVLVEKPIASTTAHAEQMVKLAERKGLILQVGHVERFNPVMAYLEKTLARPRFFEVVRLTPFPTSPFGKPRGTDVSVVLDLMIHDLEIILHIVNSPVKDLHAIGVAVLSPTEDMANVRLGFENGCVANLNASRISREQVRKIRVFQEDAYVSLDYQSQAGKVYRKVGGTIKSEDVPLEKGKPLDTELANFVDCVRFRREPRVSGRHGFEALRLAVAICEHIRGGGS